MTHPGLAIPKPHAYLQGLDGSETETLALAATDHRIPPAPWGGGKQACAREPACGSFGVCSVLALTIERTDGPNLRLWGGCCPWVTDRKEIRGGRGRTMVSGGGCPHRMVL